MALRIPVTAFRGNASWTGYAMISGHWYSAPARSMSTPPSSPTPASVGDTDTLTAGARQITVRIAGEVFDPAAAARDDRQLVHPGPRGLSLAPGKYDVALQPGTAPRSTHGAHATLGPSYSANIDTNDPFFSPSSA